MGFSILLSAKHKAILSILVTVWLIHAATAADYSHIKCVRTATNDRALNDKYAGRVDTTYPYETCQSACSGYTYFALQDHNECFCENSWSDATRFGEVSSCIAGKGGFYANSIYLVATGMIYNAYYVILTDNT